MLLSPSHITIHCSNTLNLASLLPLLKEGVSHNRLTSVRELSVPHSALLETPKENPDLILFVNGSYLKTATGGYKARYAVINLSLPLECGPQSEVKIWSDDRIYYTLWSIGTIQMLEGKHVYK